MQQKLRNKRKIQPVQRKKRQLIKILINKILGTLNYQIISKNSKFPIEAEPEIIKIINRIM